MATPPYFLYISQGIDKENLFNNSELLEWVVISCILITLTFESVVKKLKKLDGSHSEGLRGFNSLP